MSVDIAGFARLITKPVDQCQGNLLSLHHFWPGTAAQPWVMCSAGRVSNRRAWADTMLRGTIMMFSVSARVSGVCGTCMFISSPSKSALYGDVTLRFSRNVEYGRMRTR